MQIFNLVKASQFFPKYTTIKDWKHKLNGKNGRGNPIAFAQAEINQIKVGVKKMCKELLI